MNHSIALSLALLGAGCKKTDDGIKDLGEIDWSIENIERALKETGKEFGWENYIRYGGGMN